VRAAASGTIAGSRTWTSSAAVDTLGHAPQVLVDALGEQAATLIHVSNQFYSIPQLELGQLLTENSALDKVFFSNSGAEANEGAVKLARKWGKLPRSTGGRSPWWRRPASRPTRRSSSRCRSGS
jgi:4-aminobutyrate aminotransferase-like enzyme